MLQNRKSHLDSILKKINYHTEVDVNAKFPLRLLLEIDEALSASPLDKINEKLNILIKINLEQPMTMEEVQDAINKTKN